VKKLIYSEAFYIVETLFEEREVYFCSIMEFLEPNVVEGFFST
jgi:hypothetical protein